MADRIKLRRGPKNNIDLNVYELGYVTDSNEERLYFNNGSIVPIPNNKDITDIKTELTETTNVTNKNKQDVSELKESVAGIIKTGVAKLVQYSYDIELSENTKKVNIPYERYSSVTDTLKVYVNGLAIQNDQYTITDPVENDGIVTNGYIVLKVERPAGTIVRLEVWKNVPSGEEGEVSGNIIAKNSLPLDRIIGINDIRNNQNLLINGDFQVWQRGTSFNLSKNDVKYTSDRWKICCNNDTPITISRENGLKFDGANSNLYYHFEDSDFSKINNKIVTMSIMVDNNVYTETFIYNGNNSWTELFRNDKIQLAYNGTTKSIEVGLIKTVTIKWIKLELGSVATPLISKSYGEELDLCLRYYCRVKISQNLITSDDKQILVYLNVPKIMRSTPTAIFDTDIYFHNLSDGNPILIGHKGDSAASINEYSNDCILTCWLLNSSSSTQITDGMCGVINNSDKTNNRLSSSAFVILDAEIY